jgi:hypothetical protein
LTRIPLTSGAYQARSLIANAQRSINLYLEANPPETNPSVPFTIYPRPGLKLLAKCPTFGIGRGLYSDSQGNLYAVAGQTVYYVDPNFGMNAIGTIAAGTSVVSMADNAVTLLLVDGTTAGYTIDVASKAWGTISDPAFYGGNWVSYIRTVFAINRPGTKQFYISGSNAVTWNALDFGVKTSSADPLVSAPALNDQIWLLGTKKGEVWYFSGDINFPFQQLPNVVVEHGCAATYSIGQSDKFLFWLTQDKDGKPWIARGGADYSVVKISTFAMDDEIRKYTKWSDAVGYCYQVMGHTFYQIDFPSADKSWVYDLSLMGTGNEWNQYSSIDVNGVHHRLNGFLSAYAYNTNVMIDWKTGDLYSFDPETFTDATYPVVCIRGFPHIGANGNEISYPGFMADMAVGEVPNMLMDDGGTVTTNPFSAGFSSAFGPFVQQGTPIVTMRFSNTRGKSFGNKRPRSLGTTGEYDKILTWDSMGLARDGVFELEWAVPCKTALNGAFLWPEPEQAET